MWWLWLWLRFNFSSNRRNHVDFICPRKDNLYIKQELKENGSDFHFFDSNTSRLIILARIIKLLTPSKLGYSFLTSTMA